MTRTRTIRYIPRPGGTIEVDIGCHLEKIAAYFNDRADTVDGDYGEPRPNLEMQLETLVHEVLEALGLDTP